jgi:hypothetical protein
VFRVSFGEASPKHPASTHKKEREKEKKEIKRGRDTRER